MSNQSIFPVMLIGFFSSFVGIVFITYITINYGIFPLNYWANGIIPIGAVTSGVTCALGFGVGSRLIDFPATKVLYRIMLVSGGIAFMILLVAIYFAELAKFGLHINYMSFKFFIIDMFSNRKMTLNFGSSKKEVFDIGVFGILFGLGKFVGFVGGYFVVFESTRYRENLSKHS